MCRVRAVLNDAGWWYLWCHGVVLWILCVERDLVGDRANRKNVYLFVYFLFENAMNHYDQCLLRSMSMINVYDDQCL